MKRLLCLALMLCLLLSACSLSDALGRSSRKKGSDRKDADTADTAPAKESSSSVVEPGDDSEEAKPEESQGQDTPGETEPPETPEVPDETDPPSQGDQGEPLLGNNLLDNFSKDDWKRLNTFLSNFSEVGFVGYDSSDTTGKYNAPIAMFVFLHYKINDSSKLSFDNWYMWITRDRMDNCTNRFFGNTLPREDLPLYFHGTYSETIEYRNNAYYCMNGEGDSYNFLTVANRMVKTSRGTYLVSFDVYELDLREYWDDGISSSYYAMNTQQAKSQTSLSYLYTGEAEIKDYKNGSLVSFQLIRYTTPLVTEND